MKMEIPNPNHQIPNEHQGPNGGAEMLRTGNQRTPTGFNPSAPGCEERATLGHVAKIVSTLKGLYRCMPRVFGSSTLSGLWRIWVSIPRVARSSQPWANFWNPFRIYPSSLKFGIYLVFGVWCLGLSSFAADTTAEIKSAEDGTARLLVDRKSTRLNSSHVSESRMPS